MQTKTCTKCGKELPATSEYFYRKKSNKDGLMNACKTCDKQKNKEWRNKNRERCEKYRSEYYEANRKRLLDQKKEYWVNNKEKIKKYRESCKENIKQWRDAYNKKYYHRNHARILQQKKVYYSLNKEAIRQYRKNNESQIRLKRKERYITNRDEELRETKKWRQNNKDKTRIYCQNYRAVKSGLATTLTAKQWKLIQEAFNNKCAYCGNRHAKTTQEHFIPLSNSGEYTKHNIIPACQSCNSSKRDKPFEQWYPEQPFYSKERERFIYEHFTKMAEENGGWGRSRSDLGTLTIIIKEYQA